MSSVNVSSESTTASPPVKAGEMRLEVVVVPVSDVDRAKRFYETLGWRLDADLAVDDGYRVVQLTPPGSGCSIIFGEGVTAGLLTRERADVERREREINDRTVGRAHETFYAQAPQTDASLAERPRTRQPNAISGSISPWGHDRRGPCSARDLGVGSWDVARRR
jgi:catechol 2,3-dioxygenase-like lactoylglutathione lyase family enzyme